MTPTQYSPASAVLLICSLVGCSTAPASPDPTRPIPAVTRHILFVGDSYTHGRYLPVRTYNSTPGTGGLGSTAASAQVVDENFNTSVLARQESEPGETGPWGGIPGIFAEFASEAGLAYDVHLEAISATTLKTNYKAAGPVIAQPLWDAVVLQEATFQVIPSALTGNGNSNPASFCSAVDTIESGIHAVAPNAQVYLYATGAPADTAYQLTTAAGPFSNKAYLSSLSTLTAAYHDAYLSAALHNGLIAGVAQTGDAWALAWAQGAANANPYEVGANGISLTFNYQGGSMPSTRNTPTDAGFHHPSIYGAYLNALVLFQKITGTDARTLGATEQAAATLGISPTIAIQLQSIASTSILQQSPSLLPSSFDPCH